MIRRLAPLLFLALAACGDAVGDGPLSVSVIGPQPAIADPSAKRIAPPTAALLTATAQGLVRVDGAGQIEPGLAMRWDVSDDGLYYTFRLGDEAGVDAETVAELLRAATAASSRNPLRPMAAAIVEIVAVTPEVIEIRLRSPQPDLLGLLAAPEFALLIAGRGTGPLTVSGRERGMLTLVPLFPALIEDEPDPRDVARRTVHLRGERAAKAIARFVEGEADVVTGGTFTDQPYLRFVELRARLIRADPVAGLFGFAVVEAEGFLAEAVNRQALAMALDRDAIAAAMAQPGWRAASQLLPEGAAEGVAAPVQPRWTAEAISARRGLAAARVDRWTAEHEAPAPLRIAMPPGPGSRLLFALVARDWAAIGIRVERVPIDADADLRLIDLVAPTQSARWALLRFACPFSVVCDAEIDQSIAEGRFADADAMLTELSPFIAVAQPIRWSLVRQGLDGFRENARAVHPVDHLRGPGR